MGSVCLGDEFDDKGIKGNDSLLDGLSKSLDIAVAHVSNDGLSPDLLKHLKKQSSVYRDKIFAQFPNGNSANTRLNNLGGNKPISRTFGNT